MYILLLKCISHLNKVQKEARQKMEYLVAPYGPQLVVSRDVYHLMTGINNDTYDIGLEGEKIIYPTVPFNNEANTVQQIEWEINALHQTHTFYDFGHLYLSLDLRIGDKTKDDATPDKKYVLQQSIKQYTRYLNESTLGSMVS